MSQPGFFSPEFLRDKIKLEKEPDKCGPNFVDNYCSSNKWENGFCPYYIAKRTWEPHTHNNGLCLYDPETGTHIEPVFVKKKLVWNGKWIPDLERCPLEKSNLCPRVFRHSGNGDWNWNVKVTSKYILC